MRAGGESADVDQGVSRGGWAALVGACAGCWGGEGVDCYGEGWHVDNCERKVGDRAEKELFFQVSSFASIVEGYVLINVG